MKIKEMMTKNVKVLPRNATVREAAKLMKDIDVGSIPVTENDQIVGMVTDRDIVLRSTAEGHNPGDVTVGDIMTGEFFFCYEDEDVKQAARVMSDHQVRRLPIVNRQNQLVGIVSLGDLSVDAGSDKVSGQTLENISKPAKPEM